MINILVIGIGNIGGYHLQSLGGLHENAIIYIYDISIESIKQGIKKYEETYKIKNQGLLNKNNIIVIDNIDNLPKKIDFCIISTSSKERKNIFLKLINNDKCEINYFLLEKFLFTYETDYHEIIHKIDKKGLNVYVNEWMSSSYIFRRIGQILDIKKTGFPLQMTVKGANWGLECNSVHYIEYFQYLIHNNNLKFIKSEIHSHRAAKRNGYFEFFGKINISDLDGSNLILISDKGGDESYVVLTLSTVNKEINCKMWNNGLIDISYSIQNELSFEQNKIPFQSEITKEIIHNILGYNFVTLPTLKTASVHHLLVLESLREYCLKNLDGFDSKNEYPIT